MVLVVEYDGRRYHGSQWQANAPTIQGELERALLKLTGDKIRVMAASRTDAGVHARGQVVTFRTGSKLKPATFVKGLNHYLPRDIAVKAAYPVSDGFNARRDALSRRYNYYILNSDTPSPLKWHYCHRVSGQLDIEAMNRACRALIGEHDFSSFASGMGGSQKRMLRRVYRAGVEKDGDMVVFSMVANSFLPHQVRNTVGALVEVGLGKMTDKKFHSIMKAQKPGLAGPMAPACGLCLEKIDYGEAF